MSRSGFVVGAQGVTKIIEKPNGNVIVYRKDGVHLLVNPGGYGFFLETEVPDKPKKPKVKPKKDESKVTKEPWPKDEAASSKPEKKGLVA